MLTYVPWIIAVILTAAGLAWGVTVWRARRMRAQLISEWRMEDDPLAGSQLGPYRLVKNIGVGSMGSVYLAVPDATLDLTQKVAIKIVRTDPRDSDLRRRLEREIQLEMQLTHPNIVHLLDWGQQDTMMYMVTEFVDGVPLSEEIPEGGLPAAQVLDIMEQLGAAMHHAHQLGIVHRDLKPDNIIVTHSGRIKVLDFGIARSTLVGRVTAPGTTVGTPQYMAPEQALDGDCLDPRTDMYAMGCILFEMLCGDRPFDHPDTMRVIAMHLRSPLPQLPIEDKALAERVRSVIEKMMAKSVDERYPDLPSALQALRPVLAE